MAAAVVAGEREIETEIEVRVEAEFERDETVVAADSATRSRHLDTAAARGIPRGHRVCAVPPGIVRGEVPASATGSPLPIPVLSAHPPAPNTSNFESAAGSGCTIRAARQDCRL